MYADDSCFAAAACAFGVFALWSALRPDCTFLSSPPSALLSVLAYSLLGPTGNAVPPLSLSVLAIDSQSALGSTHATVATPAEVGTV